ncbi:MAG: DUF4238 domain-containing protein [Dehalococcoidia bacterium]
MKKLHHHFVPQFYLRWFSLNGKQIDGYNIQTETWFSGASIRNQCYQHKLYGGDNKLEDAFSEFEAEVAPVLKNLIVCCKLPDSQSQYWISIIQFLAFQHLRTEAAKSIADCMIQTTVNGLIDESPNTDRKLLDELQSGHNQSMHMVLRSSPQFAYGISDLSALLLIAPKNEFFLTSDNPVFLYNQYCEDIKGFGVCGAFCVGLQVLLPLSPNTCLLLYDPSVYAISKKMKDRKLFIEKGDVFWVNTMQAVGAHKLIYFNPQMSKTTIRSVVNSSLKHRRFNTVKLNKADGTHPDETSVLFHFYSQQAKISPDFSFINIKRRARRVKLFERVQKFRKEMPSDIYGDNYTQKEFGTKTRSWVLRKR